ncbi:uncharacterized protein LOC142590837 [Dermacentor variabilis]|uniref:uncharacterized protein LOC142590837 n=1 Tax=Dermacentor variabilis TaxID=34621 RepID=UPI003F5BB92B
MIRGPLLCTVSVHFTETSLLPEDGECDIIFYESFYVKNRPSDWKDSGLDHFLKLGRTMHRTSVGASFSPVGGQLFADVTTRALFDGLDRLSHLGVKHFGMMNVYGDFTIDADKLAQCLTVLKVAP